LHRGSEAMKYKILKRYYWSGLKNTIEGVLKKCIICNRNNRKQDGGEEFVESTHYLEKIAIDILHVSEEGVTVLVLIDYFTRILRIEISEQRTTEDIKETLKRIFNKTGTPKMIISDNAKEFTSREFAEYCVKVDINHHLTSIEKHNSNGRVERVIRTIRDFLVKSKEIKDIKVRVRVKKIGEVYNKTYHKGIEMFPNEAKEDKTEKIQLMNSEDGKHADRFNKRKREKFTIGNKIRISEKENLKIKGKPYDRLQKGGIVIEKCGNNSYLVKDENGRIVKRNHAHLKAEV
ncbi:hypothetical protein PAEPH01_2701, partial [Pancytospora epiphaga]